MWRALLLGSKANQSTQNPPLYLHVTSTTKEGLDKAVAKIEEMMKQELPQLVDERRFRRRDQEQAPVERDEFGRVSGFVSSFCQCLTANSANGPRRRSRLPSNRCRVSTSAPRLWDTAAPMSSTSSKRPAVGCKSRAVALATWKPRRAERAMRTCSCIARKLALSGHF